MIRKILEDFEPYEERSYVIELGKPLDKKCLQQAHFKYEDGAWKSSRLLRPLEEAREEDDLAAGLESMS